MNAHFYQITGLTSRTKDNCFDPFVSKKRIKSYHEYSGRRKRDAVVIYHNSVQKLRNEGLILGYFLQCAYQIVWNGPAVYFMRVNSKRSFSRAYLCCTDKGASISET
jgi:hypothetical protein